MWRLVIGGVLVACVTSSGCGLGGPTLYPTAGRVEFEDRSPVRNGTIEFVPDDGGPSPRGRVDADGRFELSSHAPGDGAPPGDYRVVVIQAISPRAGAVIESLGEEHAAHAGSTRVVASRHASPDTTGVRVTVEPRPTDDLVLVVQSQ